MIKTLCIIRHGETDFNKQNIVQGSGVDTVLNETGRKQAQLFFETYEHFPFDKIYTSVLQRSVQSVQGFIDKNIPHEKLEGLNEISWGDFEGKQQTEQQRKTYWETVNKWKQGYLDVSIPNGESPVEMQKRQKHAVNHILQQTHEKNVLICMHGRAMKSLLCLLLDKPLMIMEEFEHTNLCLYLLTHNNGRFKLEKRNDIAHLKI